MTNEENPQIIAKVPPIISDSNRAREKTLATSVPHCIRGQNVGFVNNRDGLYNQNSSQLHCVDAIIYYKV